MGNIFLFISNLYRTLRVDLSRITHVFKNSDNNIIIASITNHTIAEKFLSDLLLNQELKQSNNEVLYEGFNFGFEVQLYV